MKTGLLLLLSAAALCPAGEPAKAIAAETLRYQLNWPSGLTLGEATLSTAPDGNGAAYTFHIEASVPGFPLVEHVSAKASSEACSTELRKEAARGPRKSEETTTFDQAKLTAVRTTAKGGGRTEYSISPCAKDALTYLMHIRKELAGGRLPAAQKVYYGAPYQLRVDYKGTERLQHGGETVDADRMSAHIKGPASEITVEMLFAKDRQRTPLQIRVPLSMGSFRLELVR